MASFLLTTLLVLIVLYCGLQGQRITTLERNVAEHEGRILALLMSVRALRKSVEKELKKVDKACLNIEEIITKERAKDALKGKKK